MYNKELGANVTALHGFKQHTWLFTGFLTLNLLRFVKRLESEVSTISGSY